MSAPLVPSSPPPEANTPVTDNWCYTRTKLVKFTFTWTINYFSFHREKEILKSSEFSSGSGDVSKWRLSAYPTGKNEESKDYFSLYVVLVSCNDQEVWAKYKLAILNGKREETIRKQGAEYRKFTKGSDRWGYNKFVKRELLVVETTGLLPNDTLTIFCEMTVVSDNVNITGQSKSVKLKVPECRLSDDLALLLDNQRMCDVTLSAGGREMRAHKAVLAARSPVFTAMFEHDMEERKHNLVNITDVDHKVLREVLCFVYTGRATVLEDTAEDLLAAADKYALGRLKVLCEEALRKNLSVDRVAGILILADLHSADQLKAEAISYINSCVMDVMKTQGWKQMIVSHPHLVAEVLRAKAEQQLSLKERQAKLKGVATSSSISFSYPISVLY